MKSTKLFESALNLFVLLVKQLKPQIVPAGCGRSLHPSILHHRQLIILILKLTLRILSCAGRAGEGISVFRSLTSVFIINFPTQIPKMILSESANKTEKRQSAAESSSGNLVKTQR